MLKSVWRYCINIIVIVIVKVNGENLLMLEYIDAIGMEIVKSGRDQNLMQILYNHAGQPTFLAGYA